MRVRKITTLALAVLMLLSAIGCRKGNRRQSANELPPGAIVGQPIQMLPPGSVPSGGTFAAPGGAFQGLPPQGLPPQGFAPGAVPPPAPSPGMIPPTGLPPTSGYGNTRQPEILMPTTPSHVHPSNASPKPPFAPPIGTSSVQLFGPDFGDAGQSVATLYPPNNDHIALSSPLGNDGRVPPPAAKSPTGVMPPAAGITESGRLPAQPGIQGNDPGFIGFPVGIPDFAQVKSGVFSGRKPDPEGIEWLQTNKFRSVVFLHKLGEDDATLKRDVEAKGMKFHAIVIDTTSLQPAIVERFNRILAETSNQPVFVCDKSGVLAGGMWFVHLRQIDLLNDDEARVRAGRLGLREQGDEEQTQFWISLRRYLSKA